MPLNTHGLIIPESGDHVNVHGIAIDQIVVNSNNGVGGTEVWRKVTGPGVFTGNELRSRYVNYEAFVRSRDIVPSRQADLVLTIPGGPGQGFNRTATGWQQVWSTGNLNYSVSGWVIRNTSYPNDHLTWTPEGWVGQIVLMDGAGDRWLHGPQMWDPTGNSSPFELIISTDMWPYELLDRGLFLYPA